MVINAEYLIDDLIGITKVNLNKAEKIKQISNERLNFRIDPNSWTVLECIEHLNIYGNYYLPEIEKSIQQANPKDKIFKSGLLGNYFVSIIKPNGKLNKFKTPKLYDPLGANLDLSTVDTFITHQYKLIHLLNNARNVSLVKTKNSISISKYIKLRLGDTFRFVCYHNQRHLDQVENIINL